MASFSYADSTITKKEFHKNFQGVWETTEFLNGAWVKLEWIVKKRRARHLVTAYADSELTIPILKWDITRRYKLKRSSNLFAQAYNLTWKDKRANIEIFIDNPELFAQLGIDDCNLKVGEPRDLSIDNCAAPPFPFRTCKMKDFVELKDNYQVMTFGDPTQKDRCLERPTRYEGWSFTKL
jgi:hypothetical protein